MVKLILKPLIYLSLSRLHRIGAVLGQVMYFMMPGTRKLISENIKQSNLLAAEVDTSDFVKCNIQETAKGIFESLAIWQKPKEEVMSWVTGAFDWETIEAARQRGKGIIFITPHMGCFEITSLYYGSFYPITVLFRKPKRKWLRTLTSSGRAHSKVKLAPANASGVRMLIQALKKGEAIGILPDQIPGKGEGEWAPFFGKAAYTMTLASKLANKTGASVIMAYGERLDNARGFKIHLNLLAEGAIGSPSLLNNILEEQIKENPAQYLWAYPRYKTRARLTAKSAEF